MSKNEKDKHKEWNGYLHQQAEALDGFFAHVDEANRMVPWARRTQRLVDWKIRASVQWESENDSFSVADETVATDGRFARMLNDQFGGLSSDYSSLSATGDSMSTYSTSSTFIGVSDSLFRKGSDTLGHLQIKGLFDDYVTIVTEEDNQNKLIRSLREKRLNSSAEIMAGINDSVAKLGTSSVAPTDIAMQLRTYIEKLRGELNAMRTSKMQVSKANIWDAVATEAITGPQEEDRRRIFLLSAGELRELRTGVLTHIGKQDLVEDDAQLRAYHIRVIDLSRSMLSALGI